MYLRVATGQAPIPTRGVRSRHPPPRVGKCRTASETAVAAPPLIQRTPKSGLPLNGAMPDCSDRARRPCNVLRSAAAQSYLAQGQRREGGQACSWDLHPFSRLTRGTAPLPQPGFGTGPLRDIPRFGQCSSLDAGPHSVAGASRQRRGSQVRHIADTMKANTPPVLTLKCPWAATGEIIRSQSSYRRSHSAYLSRLSGGRHWANEPSLPTLGVFTRSPIGTRWQPAGIGGSTTYSAAVGQPNALRLR